MSRRAAERDLFLNLVDEEIERRRRAALVAAGGDPREALDRMLDAMAARLRSAPGFVEPSPARQRKRAHKLEMWLRRRGYSGE